MNEIARVGVDLTKRVIQVHAVDATGRVEPAGGVAIPAPPRLETPNPNDKFLPKTCVRRCITQVRPAAGQLD